MALYAVYYQTHEASPLDGEPVCSICLITQSESEAIEKEKKMTEAGYVAWYDQIQ